MYSDEDLMAHLRDEGIVEEIERPEREVELTGHEMVQVRVPCGWCAGTGVTRWCSPCQHCEGVGTVPQWIPLGEFVRHLR